MRRERWRKQKEASRENGMKVAQKGQRRKEAMTEGAQDEKCILQLAPQMTAAAQRRRGRGKERKGGSMPFGK